MAKQYITEINRFYEFVRINGLTTSEIALFLGLLQINNRCMWTEWFTAAISELELISGINTKNIYKVRNKLKQWGLIEVQSRGGNKSAKYKICNYGAAKFLPDGYSTDTRGIPDGYSADTRRIPLIDKDKDIDIYPLSSDARAKEIYKCYEENIGAFTGVIAEELDGYTELLFPEAVIYAIRQAAINNKKSCGYIKAVCKSLLNAEVKTPLDLEKYIKQREEQKQSNTAPVKKDTDKKQYMQSGRSYSDKDLFPDLFK